MKMDKDCSGCLKHDVCAYKSFIDIVIDTHDLYNFAPFTVHCSAYIAGGGIPEKAKPPVKTGGGVARSASSAGRSLTL